MKPSWGHSTPTCQLCHQEVAEAEARPIPAEGRTILVHTSCFADFAPLVVAAFGSSRITPSAVGLDRLAKNVDGRLVIVHRNYDNEQMPFLVFLAAQTGPVVVTEMYEWAEQNELHIGNPANQVLRLKNKGLVGVVQSPDGKRLIFITDEGRRTIEEYAASLG